MVLLSFLLVLIAIGVVLWLINTYIPMDANIKRILNVVVIIAVILWVLELFGLFMPLSSIRIGR